MSSVFDTITSSPWFDHVAANIWYYAPLWIVTASPFLFVCYLFLVEKVFLKSPDTIPWAGDKVQTGWFPKVNECLREKREALWRAKDGYKTFGSKGRFFMKPDLAMRPEVLVPRDHIKWFLSQKQDVLSVIEARYDRHALDCLLPEQNFDLDAVFIDTIHRTMTRNLLKVQHQLAEEITRNLDAALGKDTENWTEHGVYKTVDAAVFSAMTRILVGETVCRNESFKKEIGSYTLAYGLTVIFVGRLFPMVLRPIFGRPLFSVVIWRIEGLLRRWFNPLVNDRIAKLVKKHEDPNFDYTPPDDLVTWCTEALLTTGNIAKCSPADLARRMAILIPAAIPAVRSSTTNSIYDVMSAPPEKRVVEHLYDEIANSLDTSRSEPWADQTLVSKLVLLNSSIRETLRVNPVSVVNSHHKVVAKGGLDLPSGQHLPRGTIMALPAVGLHADEGTYEHADEFDPWRYCNRRPDDASDNSEPIKSTGVVTTTDTFLAFAAGKVACPGRWFAAHVMKLTLAYLIYNYEIKPMPTRPANSIRFNTNLPDRQATMMVRRRKH